VVGLLVLGMSILGGVSIVMFFVIALLVFVIVNSKRKANKDKIEKLEKELAKKG